MPRPVRYRWVPLALLAATAPPLACSTTLCETPHDFHATAIEPLSSPPEAVEGGTSTSLDIEGLTVRILSLDEARGDQPAPKLALRLLFDPREIAYSFDPSQVVLRGADGSEWHARVRGPGRVDRKSRRCAGDESDQAEGQSRYSFLSPATCFDLSFEVTVEHATRWELILAGLARGQRRLDPLAFRLSRTCWDVEPIDLE